MFIKKFLAILLALAMFLFYTPVSPVRAAGQGSLEPEAPVVGDWRLFAVAEGNQIRYFYSIEATLFLRENRSASLSYEGKTYVIEDWRYDRQEKNYTVFRWDAEELPDGFYYCRDGTSPYDRCLIIPLPEGETLIFHRENES